MKFIDGIDLAGQKGVNAADGSAATDLATYGQMVNLLNGLSWKDEVRAATSANVTLTAPGTSIDGVTLTNGDSVLLMGQTTAADNGIYVWTGSAATLTRRTDADSPAELKAATVRVTEGSVNADTQWTLNTDNITLGTTPLSWVSSGPQAATVYTAGNGLQLNTGAFSVKLPASSGLTADGTGLYLDTTKAVRKYAAAIGDGAATTINVAHTLGTTDITYSIKDTVSGEFVLMKGTTPDANTLRLIFPTAPASGAFRVTVHG